MAKKKNKNDAEEQRRLDALERHKRQTSMRRAKAGYDVPDGAMSFQPLMEKTPNAAEQLREMCGANEIIEAPPREPKIGDLVAMKEQHDADYYIGPFKIVAINGHVIAVTAVDPLDAGTLVLAYGYGTGSARWVFVDDPCFTRWIPDSVIQIAAVRHANTEEHKTINAPKEFQAPIPPCAACGVWPCERSDGCPDYVYVARHGVRWLPDERRLETLDEALARAVVRYDESGARIPIQKPTALVDSGKP